MDAQTRAQESAKNAVSSGKFPDKRVWRDLWAAIAFWIHLGLLIWILCANISTLNNHNAKLLFSIDRTVEPHPILAEDPNGDQNQDGNNNDTLITNGWGVILAITCVGMVGFSVFWLYLIKKKAKDMIWGTNIAFAGLCGIFGLYVMASGGVAGGIVMIVMGALILLWLYLSRDRIPFAQAVLESSVTVIDKYPSTLYVSFASFAVAALYLVLWAATFLIWAVNNNNSQQNGGDGGNPGTLVYLMFSMFWTMQVISNVVFTTIAGLVATWYFFAGDAMPQNPCSASFKRATTTSFGSICLGSLIVAVIKTLHWLVQSARNNSKNSNSFVLCCLDCFLGWLDSLARLFNKFAYVEIAMYGKPFVQASSDVMSLLTRDDGLKVIIDNNLVNAVLVVACILGGLVAFAFSFTADLLVSHDIKSATAIGLVALVFGFFIMSVFMDVLGTAVLTLLVCFAEDHGDAIAARLPGLHGEIQKAKVLSTGYNRV